MNMFKSLRCKIKGHTFVDSRSLPGMQTCIRCRTRQPFESLKMGPVITESPGPISPEA
jgi:hypothetical protein